MKILFIGNSYTYYNDMPTALFKPMAESLGQAVEVAAVTKGGYTLEKHADPADPYGAQVEQALAEGHDYVILQEQSLRPVVEPERFFEAVRRLAEKIRRSGAKPILYATWGRRPGHEKLQELGLTNGEMTLGLSAAYRQIGKELEIPVAYVGQAFGGLEELYDPDGSHPSLAGSYLVAATLCARIFGVDPTESAFTAGLEQAPLLLKAAKEAVWGSHFDLLYELAQIPAPSNHEEKRAEFCKNWLEAQGAEGVYIDEALNVVYPLGDTGGEVTVYMAHSDVVFPDTEPLPLRVEDGKVFCPGVGDDTANAVALMAAAGEIARNKLQPREGLVLVINSGEEGLGNLKGVRKIMEDYHVRELISFDSNATSMTVRAVGSKRYKVAIDTEGGHSYGAFGNRNAIAYLAALINDLYQIKVPPMGKTTFNVGTIEGGTSVNTIAQHAEMLYEFRSDEREALDVMERHFEAAIAFYRTKGITVTVTPVGDRPCSGAVDESRQQALVERAAAAVKKHYGYDVVLRSGSTDCNIPLSLGVPAVCPGCVEGAGAHTREESISIESLEPGIRVAKELIFSHF